VRMEVEAAQVGDQGTASNRDWSGRSPLALMLGVDVYLHRCPGEVIVEGEGQTLWGPHSRTLQVEPATRSVVRGINQHITANCNRRDTYQSRGIIPFPTAAGGRDSPTTRYSRPPNSPVRPPPRASTTRNVVSLQPGLERSSTRPIPRIQPSSAPSPTMVSVFHPQRPSSKSQPGVQTVGGTATRDTGERDGDLRLTLYAEEP